jgi:hypothetical protein
VAPVALHLAQRAASAHLAATRVSEAFATADYFASVAAQIANLVDTGTDSLPTGNFVLMI